MEERMNVLWIRDYYYCKIALSSIYFHWLILCRQQISKFGLFVISLRFLLWEVYLKSLFVNEENCCFTENISFVKVKSFSDWIFVTDKEQEGQMYGKWKQYRIYILMHPYLKYLLIKYSCSLLPNTWHQNILKTSSYFGTSQDHYEGWGYLFDTL